MDNAGMSEHDAGAGTEEKCVNARDPAVHTCTLSVSRYIQTSTLCEY